MCKHIRQGPSVGHSDNASITYIMEAKVFEEKQKVRREKTDIGHHMALESASIQ